MLTEQRQPIPIFDIYTLDYLADRLGYSEVYLISLKSGWHPVRPRFRKTAARILDRSEVELFGELVSEEERSDGQDITTPEDPR